MPSYISPEDFLPADGPGGSAGLDIDRVKEVLENID
jgi:hypothetical protein